MVSMLELSKIVSCLTKLEKVAGTARLKEEKVIFDFVKKMTGGYGTDLSPIVYKGKYLKELPTGLQTLTSRLKKPSVVVNGYSRVNGRGILNSIIMDGNNTIGTSVLGIDLTRGEPIIKLRVNYGNGTQNALSFNCILNANKSGSSALMRNFKINKKIASEVGISQDVLTKARQAQRVSSNMVDDLSNAVRTFFKAKGNVVRSVEDIMPSFVQTAQQTGRVTQKSATKAVRTVISDMGYNPKNITIKFMDKTADAGGAFNFVTGELELNLNQLKSHQDLAVILGHELTHMEDFILLYKKLGAEKFKKLLGGVEFNQKWYDKMAQNVLRKDCAFEGSNDIVTGIIIDGKKITNPEEIKALLATEPQIPIFNLDVMQKELQAELRRSKRKISGNYSCFKERLEYIDSYIEKHARKTERCILGHIGNIRKTSISSTYGRDVANKTQEEMFLLFKQIDNALAKQGNDRGQIFNDLYRNSLEKIDVEISNLRATLRNGNITEQEFNKILNDIKILTQKRYGNAENLELKILENMQESLNLRKVQNITQDDALAKVDPEFAEILAKMRKGAPKAEFNELIKRKDTLIQQRYFGNEHILWGKVSAKHDELTKEMIENPFVI